MRRKKEYRFTITLKEAEAILSGEIESDLSEDGRLLLKLLVEKAKESGVGLDKLIVKE